MWDVINEIPRRNVLRHHRTYCTNNQIAFGHERAHRSYWVNICAKWRRVVSVLTQREELRAAQSEPPHLRYVYLLSAFEGTSSVYVGSCTHQRRSINECWARLPHTIPDWSPRPTEINTAASIYIVAFKRNSTDTFTHVVLRTRQDESAYPKRSSDSGDAEEEVCRDSALQAHILRVRAGLEGCCRERALRAQSRLHSWTNQLAAVRQPHRGAPERRFKKTTRGAGMNLFINMHYKTIILFSFMYLFILMILNKVFKCHIYFLLLFLVKLKKKNFYISVYAYLKSFESKCLWNDYKKLLLY